MDAEGHLSTIAVRVGYSGQAADANGSVQQRLRELLDNRLTAARAARLDADISSRASAADWTSARAALVDRLDATISSRLAAASYVAPDNAGIASIITRLGTGGSDFTARLDAIASYVDTEVAAIKAKTDAFADPSRLDAAISTRASASDWTAARAARLDADISSRAAPGAAMRLDAGGKDDVVVALRLASFDDPGYQGGSLAEYVIGIKGKTDAFADPSRLDATISSRAPASTALTNATWTDARAALVDRLDATVSSRAAPGAAMRLDASGRADVVTALRDATFDDAGYASDSLAGYVIGIKGKTDGLPAAPASQGDVQAGPNVPAIDSTLNATLAQVVGRKDDSPVPTLGNTTPLAGYVRALVGSNASAFATGTIGHRVEAIFTALGATEGGSALHQKLTAARAALIDRLDATISSRSSHSAADVWAVGTRALTDKAGFSLAATGLSGVTAPPWKRASKDTDGAFVNKFTDGTTYALGASMALVAESGVVEIGEGVAWLQFEFESRYTNFTGHYNVDLRLYDLATEREIIVRSYTGLNSTSFTNRVSDDTGRYRVLVGVSLGSGTNITEHIVGPVRARFYGQNVSGADGSVRNLKFNVRTFARTQM